MAEVRVKQAQTQGKMADFMYKCYKTYINRCNSRMGGPYTITTTGWGEGSQVPGVRDGGGQGSPGGLQEGPDGLHEVNMASIWLHMALYGLLGTPAAFLATRYHVRRWC